MKIRTNLKPGWWYLVQSGDTLAKIAQKNYGDGNMWPQIYNYQNNRKIIGPNPNELRAGTSIQLW